MKGPLDGIKVFDLTRVLAGPHCTQILGDLGAEVIKVERPGSGDDTRGFAPPYQSNDKGEQTSESAYYTGANRNKRSITINLSTPEGQALAKKLMADFDILVENFKTGTLERYSLGYDQLKSEFPRLIYCSVTGFGQTGPYAARPGYDGLIQAMGGVMSITGVPDGEPMKVAVPICDLMAGMYATVGIL
ncbi:MAG: CaiB/BaiF CoA-transferase family protein, partial [Pseudomonadota bacterium]|nr:CaiB/BaiF CoA-transferase family protein [Pseudomonadota bacterium]